MPIDVVGWIGFASNVIDDLGVGVILAGIAIAGGRFLLSLQNKKEQSTQFDLLRVRIGRGLLLGLEILVAADVIRTVALDPTLGNFLTLGVLVVIRTVLSWSLFLEIENRWPWQKS